MQSTYLRFRSPISYPGSLLPRGEGNVVCKVVGMFILNCQDQCTHDATELATSIRAVVRAHQNGHCTRRFPNSFPPDFTASETKTSACFRRYVPSFSPNL